MGVSGQHHIPAALLSSVLTGLEAGWASELVWIQRLEEKTFASARDQTPVVQSVVRHYTDWANPSTLCTSKHMETQL